MYNVAFRLDGSKLCFENTSDRTYAVQALLQHLGVEREFLSQQAISASKVIIFWETESASRAHQILCDLNVGYEASRRTLIATLKSRNLKITEISHQGNPKSASSNLGVDAKEYEIVRSNVSVGLKFQKPWTSGPPVPLLPDFLRFH